MDLNKGFSLKQQQNYDIQQLWAPTTPAKATSANSQRSQPPGCSWHEPTVMPCQLRSSSSPGLPIHLRGGHHTLACTGHASMGSSSNANSECWSPLMPGSAAAVCNADGMSKMLPCRPCLVQIARRWEMPSAQNMFMAEGKLVLAPNLSSNRCSCCSVQTDRLSVASTPNCDPLNAPPTPATTEKFNKRPQDKQPSSKVTELVEEWGRENQMAKEVSSYQPKMKRPRSDSGIPVVYEEISNRLIRVENSSTDKETKAIDLLETPNKRPQRKKHRPKVFKEGKPSRTPKLATSPSAMDGTSCKRKYVRRNKDATHSSEKENTSCRRKYARRCKDAAHSLNTNAFEAIIEAESKGKAKSPRRCLNFDSEDPQANEEFSAAMLVFKKVLGDRGRGVRYESAATSSSLTKTADSNWVQNQIVVKPSTYQSQNECLQQIPVPCDEVNKNICALDEQIPSFKSSVKHFKALARESACSELSRPKSSLEISQSNLRACLAPRFGSSEAADGCATEVTQMGRAAEQCSTQSATVLMHPAQAGSGGLQSGVAVHFLPASRGRSPPKRTLNPLGIFDSPPKDMKMDYLSTDETRESAQKGITHSYNLRGCSRKSEDAVKKNLSLTGVHKAIRTEKWGHNEANPKFFPSWKIKQLSNNLLEFNFAEAQRFVAQEKAQILERILAFQTEECAIRNLGLDSGLASLSSITSWGRKSTPTKQFKQKNKDIIQPSTPENKICGNQTHCQKYEDIGKSLQQAQIHLLYSTSLSTKNTREEVRKEAHSNGISPAQKTANIGVLATRNLNGKKLYPETISADCPSTSYFNVPTYSNFSSGALVTYVDPVDCIVEKLRLLYISSHHEVTSSHPAGHEFMMVPYDRSLELAKRRRPRAKVDLDPESNRVWKLLMGKNCGEGGGPPDVDKEKWWDEERRVFEGRVNSFIARMHLVQGDRRYSQWKGSVVDSVVGVFLTQNVSDHLSSSAFMSLAANFPLSSSGKFSVPETERVNTSMESQNRSLFDNELFFQSSLEVSVPQNGEGKESSNCSEILGSANRSSIAYYSRQKGKGKGRDLRKKEVVLCQEPTVSGSVCGSGINLGETEDIRLTDSQNSVVSSQKYNGFHANLNFEAGDLFSGIANALGSFTELLQMAEKTGLKEFCNNVSGMISESQNKESALSLRNNPFLTSQLDNSEDTFQSCNVDSSLHHAKLGLSDMLLPEPSQSDDLFNSKEKIRSHLQTTTSEISSCNLFEFMSGKCDESEGSVVESTIPDKLLSSFKPTTNDSTRTQTTQNITLTEMYVRANLLSSNHKNTSADAIDTSKNENLEVCISLETELMTRFQQEDENSIFKEERTRDSVKPSHEPCGNQQASVSNNQTECNFDMPDRFGPNLKAETCSFPKTYPETANSAINTRKHKSETEKSTYDWESLRKEVCFNKPAEERSSTTMDSLDWEAVRTAHVSKVAEAIRARGMNNVLAERIQEFLNRLVREHGSIDLEWLRDVSPDKVKDYLLSVRGLGLKSAECVRLLTLRQLAFPVDTNVGRICVRLGWVPLQPLPESLQLHLLELYPVLATIQKYLWPRLCKLDQRTLYELHYQMITFGKVFCTKSKPNCNSCPMRGECRHFASAFASARLALPAPEDKSLLSLTSPIASDESPNVFLNLRPFPQIEESLYSQKFAFQNNGEPIIEEPASPEPECQESLESAIEDAFYEDPEEIPTIKLNLPEFTQNLRNYMKENMELQDGSLSKALVTLTPEAASIPMPKLKNVSRLRTEHQVYEIPDTHPLLERLDPREPDDPSPYLLAIWTPGETAQSTEPPIADCNLQDVGQPCERSVCFGCSSIPEAESHKIRGTLLIPCRTAMRGSFPLNGTYFQVNEVFADHHSSREPVYVLRDWIWNLPRRTVYFGTSIPTIFRGLTTEGIQQCFWRGFVCVRGFDRVTRAPKPLYARLHFPASKATKNRNTGEPKVEKNNSN